MVCACGQMHGSVLIDGNGNLTMDTALLWNDKRPIKEVADFKKNNNCEELLSITANPPTTAWPAFKLAWIKNNLPLVWEKTKTLLMPKDYINFKLTGQIGTDYSEASCFYLMDSKEKSYSDKMLNLFSIPKDILPQIHNSYDILGNISKQISQQTNLPEGLPVVYGTSDMAASLLGSGVYKPGTASDSTGTSTLITVVSKKPVLNSNLNNLHLVNNAWGGFTILDSGGDAMRWARLAFHDNKISYKDIVKMAATSPTGANGLFFLPYLTGERVAKKTNSRAQFFGLTRQHRANDLHRAVMEGVAFGANRNLKLLTQHSVKIEKMIASGGGAKTDLWLQIKAAVYGIPIIKPESSENGTLGCVITGGIGVGLYNDMDHAVKKIVKYEKEYLPDDKNNKYYMKSYKIFEQLYENSQNYYDLLDELRSVQDEL